MFSQKSLCFLRHPRVILVIMSLLIIVSLTALCFLKIDLIEFAQANTKETTLELIITPPSTPPPSGGGGGWVPPAETKVIIQGKAYPLSPVTVFQDGKIAITTIADSQANFKIEITNITAGIWTFGIWAEDKEGRKSITFNFTTSITSGMTTTISGIFLPPTIAVDKSEVKRGDNIAIFGQSVPKSEITILVSSEEEFFVKTKSDKDGIYLSNFDTLPLSMGQHFTKSKAALDGEISSFSKAIGFLVGTENVFVQPIECPLEADLDNDCRVNLVDFSILFYWFGHFDFPAEVDLNGDGRIDLIDFSIVFYYWAG